MPPTSREQAELVDDGPAPSGMLLGPDHRPPELEGSVEEQALTLFKAMLYNEPGQRDKLSNAIVTWDLLPKYSGERHNGLDILPDSHECEFTLHGRRLKMVLFPGTIYREGETDDKKTTRRYPGGREQAVERALIKIACEQAEALEREGTTVYQVNFSLRHLQSELARIGSKYKHTQIYESLEILSSTTITLYDNGGQSIRRMNLLPGFVCMGSAAHKATNSPRAQWSVTLNPIVAQAIRNVSYRQHNLELFKGLRPHGVYILQSIILTATNISSNHPFQVSYSELQVMTSGLNFSRPRDGINYVDSELKRLKANAAIKDWKREDHKTLRRDTGRRAVTDATFTIYPTTTLVGDVKASSKKQSAAEQSLKLPRSKRADRQMALPLGGSEKSGAD